MQCDPSTPRMTLPRLTLLFLLIANMVVTGAAGAKAAPSPHTAAVSAPPQQQPQALSTPHERRRVIVRLGDNTIVASGAAPGASALDAQEIANLQQQLRQEITAYDAEIVAALHAIPFAVLDVDAAALDALTRSPLVTNIQQDRLAWPLLSGSVPHIGAPLLWADNYDGRGQTVVVLDSGIDRTHPFFAGRIIDEACFSSSAPGVATPLCPNGSTSQTGPGAAHVLTSGCIVNGQQRCPHGTHTAGIAAGAPYSTTTSSGVAPGVNLIPIQIFTRVDDAGTCYPYATPCFGSFTADQLRALDYILTTLASTYRVAAVNMSIGAGIYSDQALCDSENAATQAAVAALRDVGIATVIATGNNGLRNGIAQPACVSSAIAVSSASDPTDVVSSFSNMHAMVELLAPGQGIVSSYPNNTYTSLNGTSMAAPHVAGAWALLKQLHPTASVDEILAAFSNTGVPVTDTRSFGTVTKARIQVDAAHSWLESRIPTATLGDRVWFDRNGDGIQDTGEPGLDNVQINIFNDAFGNEAQVAEAGEFIMSTHTVTGVYGIEVPAANTYLIEVDERNFAPGMPLAGMSYTGDQATQTYSGGTPRSVAFPNATAIEDNADFGYSVQGAVAVTVTTTALEPIRTGENFTVTITVRNSGAITLPVVPLRHTFDVQYLNYNGAPPASAVAAATATTANSTTTTLSWSNIAPGAGLAPGAAVSVVLPFGAVRDTTHLPAHGSCPEAGETCIETSVLEAAGDPDGAGPLGAVALVPDVQLSSALSLLGPTGSMIAQSDVTPAASGFHVRWRTLNEANIVGFRVIRVVEGVAAPVGAELIPAKMSGIPRGAEYALYDAYTSAGAHVAYRLEIILSSGGMVETPLDQPSPRTMRSYLPLIPRD